MADGFRLVVSQGPQPGQAFVLDRDAMTVGRDPGNSIAINDPQVSRQHARITNQGGLMVIEDLGSTNGTFINGMRLTGPHALTNGDAIGMGESVTLTFHATAPASTEAMAAGPAAPSPPAYVPPAPAPPAYEPPAYAPAAPEGMASPDAPPAFEYEDEEEEEGKGRGRIGLYIGCGCLVLLVVGACVGVFVLDYLRLLPAIFYEPFRMLGLI
jgi:hypothetical protein